MPDLYVSGKGEKGVEGKEAGGKKEMVDTDVSAFVPQDKVEAIVERAGERRRSELWGAYCVLPKSRFINEQHDEDIVLLLRGHPITNVGWILLTLVMLLLPSLFEAVGVFEAFPNRFVFIGKLAWYLVTLGFSFEKFLKWYYSVFIVTNERLVDIDFVNLLYRMVSYTNLNHIEEPTMTMGGFLRSMLHYGDVRVATAAERGQLEALAVPFPDKVVAIISELSEELEKRRERGE